MLRELVVGFDEFLGLFFVFLDFVPIFGLGFVGQHAQVGEDGERVVGLVLDAHGVGALDGDMHDAVFLLVGVEDVADASPKAFFHLCLGHVDGGVFRYRCDHNLLFGWRWHVGVDGAVEFGQGVEVVELL